MFGVWRRSPARGLDAKPWLRISLRMYLDFRYQATECLSSLGPLCSLLDDVFDAPKIHGIVIGLQRVGDDDDFHFTSIGRNRDHELVCGPNRRQLKFSSV